MPCILLLHLRPGSYYTCPRLDYQPRQVTAYTYANEKVRLSARARLNIGTRGRVSKIRTSDGHCRLCVCLLAYGL